MVLPPTGIKFKLQLIEPNRWGVYAKPHGVTPTTNNTIIGSGQVTVVMPAGYNVSPNTNVNGTWTSTTTINAPNENPTRRYKSYGFNNEVPMVQWQAGTETLLFTFNGNGTCPDSLYLIDNVTDPFNVLPNSMGNHPGNEITVFDMMTGDVYEYAGNYAPSAWSCEDNDDDGLLNAQEDTNGNGVFDSGMDYSDLNTPCTTLVTITEHPDDIYSCAGDEAYFVADFNNAGAANPADPNLTLTQHYWQINTGSGWNIINPSPGVYSGIYGSNIGASGDNDTLTIANVVGLDGYQYRICYTTPACPIPVCSNPATLEVRGNVSFNIDPANATVCAGNDTTFFATAAIPQGSFSFGWEYLDAPYTGAWTPITFPDANYSHSITGSVSSGTDILTITNVAGMYGRRFRAVANATDCGAVYSAYATLNVQGPLSVADQPDPVTECYGNATSFTAKIANPGMFGSTTVHWQISRDNGVTWQNLPASSPTLYSGVTSVNYSTGVSTLAIPNVAVPGHNALFRIAYRTSTCTIQYSNSARLTVEGPITVTDQPDDVDGCAGEAASFTSTAEVGTAGTLTYRWQVSPDNGTNWSDITALMDGGVYTNFTTTTLNVSNSTGLYNRFYRLAFSTGECNRVYSDRACLNIDGPLSFAAHPQDVIQCTGEAALFGAVAVTGSLEADALTQIQYRWQYSTDGGTTWIWLNNDTLYNGVNTDTMSISYTTYLDGNMYRLAIWTDDCDTIYSDAALLDIEGPLTVTDEPDNITECAGSAVSFGATVAIQHGDPASLTYQWEYSAYNLGTGTYAPYVNVPTATGDVFSGETTTTLNISDVANMFRWRFRMRYRSPNCDASWTNYAQLTVEGPISVTNHPDHRTVCSGSATSFCIQAANSGQGAITYQWQVCMSGDSLAGPWNNLPTSSIYNGVTNGCLSVGNVVNKDGFYFRCLVQTSECNPVASYAAVLRVEGPISIISHPTDQTTCQGSPAIFTAVASTMVGDLLNQWQVSSDGVNYSDLQEGGPNEIESIDTPPLSIGNTEGLNGKRFRLAAKTGGCNYIFSQPATLTTTDCGPKCLKAKLQLQPDSTSWAVVAKPSGSFDPTENAMTTAGRFTVVAPANFNLIGLNSFAGKWSAMQVTENVAGYPGKKFITFEMNTPAGSGVHIPYSIQQETPLFRFDHAGPCPEFLYLLEEVPDGLQPNLLVGSDLVDNFTPVDFEYCSVYGRKAWRCKKPGGLGGPIIVVTTDSLETDEPQAVVDRDDGIAEGNKAIETAWFTTAPNPAGDHVNITVSTTLAEGQPKLYLFDLQGKKWQEAAVNQAVTRMDLVGMPAGVYFVSLAQNGRVLQREKLVKH